MSQALKDRAGDADPRLAAVDLGSNSFHIIIARPCGRRLESLDRHRETVRLAAGLDAEGRLSSEVRQRALKALARIAGQLDGIPARQVRAVSTNTLRVAVNGEAFRRRAEKALGYPITIISGEQEARLIYAGVSRDLPKSGRRRLVIDIGGGSTELILGKNRRVRWLSSLPLGCVAFSLRYFPKGKLKRATFDMAEAAVAAELAPLQTELAPSVWDEVYGASGTINAISRLQSPPGIQLPLITMAGLDELRDRLVAAGRVDRIPARGLRRDRRPVLPGGLAILRGIFASLGIEALRPSASALREGLLYQILDDLAEGSAD